MTKRFAMKHKPPKPTRDTLTEYVSVERDVTLREIYERHQDRASELILRVDDGYDGPSDVYFERKYPEPEEQFQDRMEKYQNRLEEYNQWCLDHKDKIKEYEEKQEAARLKRIASDLKYLEKQKADIEKKIKALK